MKQKFKLLSAVIIAGSIMDTNAHAQNVNAGAGQTTGVIPKWQNGGAYALTNSQIQDNGTNVGIGLAPSYKLDVNGHANIAGSSAYKIGGNTMFWNNGNTNDILIGLNAGNATMSGHYNNFFGNSAGVNQTTGAGCTFVGYQAGEYNSDGDYNTFVGYNAGQTAGYTSTTGDYNTIVGVNAGIVSVASHTYSGNSLFGYNAGQALLTGVNNCFTGYESGSRTTTGSQNVANGGYALYNNSTSTWNTAVGYQSLYLTSTGGNNTAVGLNAGYTNTTGTYSSKPN